MPEKVTRSFQKGPLAGRNREFLVYERAEADREGIEYLDPWWRAIPGEWVLTTDGYVMQMARRVGYRQGNSIRYCCDFVVGKQWWIRDVRTGNVRSTPDVVAGPYLERGVWTGAGKNPQNWIEQEVKKSRAKVFAEMVARRMILRNGRLHEEDWVEVGEEFRPKDEIPAASAKRFFKTPEAKIMVAERLEKILNGKGVSAEAVLEGYQNLLEASLEEKDFKTARQVLDKLAQLTDLELDKEPNLRRLPGGFPVQNFLPLKEHSGDGSDEFDDADYVIEGPDEDWAEDYE